MRILSKNKTRVRFIGPDQDPRDVKRVRGAENKLSDEGRWSPSTPGAGRAAETGERDREERFPAPRVYIHMHTLLAR
eukprot:2887183-Prymnesium_polylepis.1